jgi:predicted GH43/DUF377 family glycosyl hydrolase
VKLERYAGNPILSPRPDSDWENICATNPGAWEEAGKVYLLYRGGPDTDAHPIYFGLAESDDGFNFKRVQAQPVFGPCPGSFDGGCVEDPRIVKFDGTFFVTYAARMFPPAAYWKKTFPLNAYNPSLPAEAPAAARDNLTRSALAMTRDFQTWYRMGPITPASVDDRDAMIFPGKVGGRFALLHRPVSWIGPAYGCAKPSIWLSLSDDLLVWKDDHLLAQPYFAWESAKVGGGAPPLRTDRGWLVLYHGVDGRQVYRVGAMMLDLDDPRRVLARTPEPILEPELPYEKVGLVPNVVFPCGNVVIGDRLFVYYGGADTCCCVATIGLCELVEHVMRHPWRETSG